MPRSLLKLLAALLVVCLVPYKLATALEVVDLRGRPAGEQGAGRHLLATNECVAKGLAGECNGCVCCCYNNGAGILSYLPTDTCTCARKVNSAQIWATVVLSIIVVLGGLLVQLYFGGSLPVSPYPTHEQQRQRQRSARQRSARQRSGRITPEDAQQRQPPAAATML